MRAGHGGRGGRDAVKWAVSSGTWYVLVGTMFLPASVIGLIRGGNPTWKVLLLGAAGAACALLWIEMLRQFLRGERE
ncbi:hypothetical protein [Actinospongicola halichondriae]|uniref:hypothetical protein n=1 Tax=Actinospongicola halichondriae TaxID=3236844 RepID=UPI003D37AF8C